MFLKKGGNAMKRKFKFVGLVLAASMLFVCGCESGNTSLDATVSSEVTTSSTQSVTTSSTQSETTSVASKIGTEESKVNSFFKQ